MKFKLLDRVEFHSLGGDYLEGKTGVIHGVASRFPTPIFHIVQLDEPIPDLYYSVVMPDVCLKKID